MEDITIDERRSENVWNEMRIAIWKIDKRKNVEERREREREMEGDRTTQ